MRRVGIVLVVGLTVLAGVAPPVGGLQVAASPTGVDGETTWGQTTPPEDSGNETTEAAPGTRLAGSVGVQGAELSGELETRSLDQQLNRSNSNASKAHVISRQANQNQARLATLRAERQQLETAQENGSISENEYRVRAAQLSARAVALERVSNRTRQTASRLPAETLRQNGVNVTSLETLRSSADRLTGPDIAAIARTLAGPGAARGTGLERANNASTGAAAGRTSDSPGRSGGPPEGRANASGGDSSASGDAASGNETATSNGRTGEGSAGGTGKDRSGNSDGSDRSGNSDGNDRSGNSDGNDQSDNSSENDRGGSSTRNSPHSNGSANTADPGRSGTRVDEN